MQIQTLLSNRNNYGNKRATSQIKYIVIHYTANDGDKAVNNAKYFNSRVVKASAHYFVDDTEIWQSVPDDYVAWAVGGSKYKNTKGGTLHGIATNANTISIELTDTVKNGVVEPTAKTVANAMALTKELMAKYNIPVDRVIRHYDVTGKLCPAYWVDENRWRNEFKNKLTAKAPASTPTPAPAPAPSAPKAEQKYKVTASTLNVRKGPGTSYGIATTVKKNEVYTIVETNGTWGKLKSGAGWVSLSYMQKV